MLTTFQRRRILIRPKVYNFDHPVMSECYELLKVKWSFYYHGVVKNCALSVNIPFTA